MRVGALGVGALALCVMAAAVISDWVFEDGKLPDFGFAFFALSSGFWLVALVLVLTGRSTPIVLAAAASPVVIAISWQLLET